MVLKIYVYISYRYLLHHVQKFKFTYCTFCSYYIVTYINIFYGEIFFFSSFIRENVNFANIGGGFGNISLFHHCILRMLIAFKML